MDFSLVKIFSGKALQVFELQVSAKPNQSGWQRRQGVP